MSDITSDIASIFCDTITHTGVCVYIFQEIFITIKIY